MTSLELQPFVGKRVALTLQGGEVLVGMLRSTEARVMDLGEYAIESPGRIDPPTGPTYRGVRHSEFVESVRELPTFLHWCQAIGEAVRTTLKYVEISIVDERSATFSIASRIVQLRSTSDLEAQLVPPLSRGGTIAEGERLSARTQRVSVQQFAIGSDSVAVAAAAIVTCLNAERH